MENWQTDTSVDDRFALTAKQNCPLTLITSIDFDFTFDDDQTGVIFHTTTGSVTASGASGVVLRNASDCYFGVLLSKDYDSAAAALAKINYSYNLVKANASSSNSSDSN